MYYYHDHNTSSTVLKAKYRKSPPPPGLYRLLPLTSFPLLLTPSPITKKGRRGGEIPEVACPFVRLTFRPIEQKWFNCWCVIVTTTLGVPDSKGLLPFSLFSPSFFCSSLTLPSYSPPSPLALSACLEKSVV